MKLTALMICSLALFFGCKDVATQSDVTPPSPPQALSFFAGDHLVNIFWYPSQDQDVAGYNVYVSSTATGKFTFIARTTQKHYIDQAVVNGETYYYAVSAYDRTGNESALSSEIVQATPRPEGFNVLLPDYRRAPNIAGFEFSTNTVGPYDDQHTDVFFEHSDSTNYFDVWYDSNIQDFGYTSSLDDITQAPQAGWSPTKDVRIIVGHTYVIQTFDNHYAKVRVSAVSSSSVVFDWAYQAQAGNQSLKPSMSVRSPLVPGSGFLSRR